MILVPLLNPKFATVPAAKSCELRVRGTSRLLKFVFEGGGCATLIQDRALRRTKDSARPGPGFENFASFASIGVFQQPARSSARLAELSVAVRPAVVTRPAGLIRIADAGAADTAQVRHALRIARVVARLPAAFIAAQRAPRVVVGRLGGARMRLGDESEAEEGEEQQSAHGCSPGRFLPRPDAFRH